MSQAVPLINVIREDTVCLFRKTRCFLLLSLILDKGNKRSEKTIGAPHLVLCESCENLKSVMNTVSTTISLAPKVLAILPAITAFAVALSY
ncbi:MAG: hypothetical protein WAZ77_23725 [Candidatus Nitrosopolaris sp.]|jgi:hypothetical protein